MTRPTRRCGLIVNITWVLDCPHVHAFYEVPNTAKNKLTEQWRTTSGRTASSASRFAREYGFTDVDGKQQSAFWDERGRRRLPAPPARNADNSCSLGLDTNTCSH